MISVKVSLNIIFAGMNAAFLGTIKVFSGELLSVPEVDVRTSSSAGDSVRLSSAVQ